MRRLLLAVALLLPACHRGPDLPVLYAVPPFTLTSERGQEFSSARESATPTFYAPLASHSIARCHASSKVSACATPQGLACLTITTAGSCPRNSAHSSSAASASL